MEDPVTVQGIQVTKQESWYDIDSMDNPMMVTVHLIYVTIPGIPRYILKIDRSNGLCECNTWSLEMQLLYDPPTSWSPMDVPRSRVIQLIDASILSLNSDIKTRIQEIAEVMIKEIRVLDAWKTQLVLEKLQRNAAARTIQRQFKESISNPAYDICKRRLLREFAEGIKN